VGPPGLGEFHSAPNLKFKTDVISCSKNIQTLHEPRVEYSEQLLQLGRLQIPNIIHVIIFGIKSTLNFPSIFYWGSNISGKIS
jgi:hypothetical protein